MNQEIGPISLDWIAECISLNRYILTAHAETERRNDELAITDLEEALNSAEILESYPDDPRGTSCLVLGDSSKGLIHLVCARNRHDWLVLVTVYIPTMPKWKTPRERNRP